ncbi:MAG: succinylglutamate desuccinylase/aspartoacylase family protein [Myxococcales bacterium]|nr:succinylglutamate desuccinylase/aspartoacylase family protein [Myxococcales bacterium]
MSVPSLSETKLARVIGDTGPGGDGPTVIAFGAIHGNEPAGVWALGKLFAELTARPRPLRGRMIGLVANTGACAAGRRFIERDLNRSWDAERIAALLASDPANDGPEDAEQRELLHVLTPLLAEADRPLVFLDLHSSSGAGGPFSCMADVLRNRPIAFGVPVPVILGLEEVIDGALIGYLSDMGHVGVAFEGGRHADASTVDNHLAILWLTMVNAGVIDAGQVPELEAHRARLNEATAGLPEVLEIRHRHVITPEDVFKMRPGFANFQPLPAGSEVADDVRGPVRTPEEGMMMLPLYQGQGDDGYFIARPVSRFWLRLSGRIRGDSIDRLLPALPGVHRDPEQPDHFLVDPRIARYRTTEVFHLFGYRRARPHGDLLTFSRRRPDVDRLSPLPDELRPLMPE